MTGLFMFPGATAFPYSDLDLPPVNDIFLPGMFNLSSGRRI